MTNAVAYMKREGRLPVVLRNALQNLSSLTQRELRQVRVAVKPTSWGPFTWAQPQWRGGVPEGCWTGVAGFVVGPTIYAQEDALLTGAFKLTSVSGFAAFAHEVFHAAQFARRGWWWLLWQYAKGITRSWLGTRTLWAHHLIPMEQEAIRFQSDVRAYCRAHVDVWDEYRDQLGA